jgi:hypothetical protein
MLKSDCHNLAKAVMADANFRRSLRLGMPLSEAIKLSLKSQSMGEQGKSEVHNRMVDVHAPNGSNKGKGWVGMKPGINGRHSGSRKHKR